jgi:RNA polymerase sigma factor (sigma-70 family)
MNHENIVNRRKQGDAKAQKVLYDFFAPEMLGIAYRYVAGYDLANELLQLTFIKAFNNINHVDSQKIRSWLKKITVNTALNILKQERKSNEPLNEDCFKVQISSEEYASDIIYLINRLPKSKRIIFNLHAIEGYSFKEIGQMLNLTEGNAKIKYHRTKKEVQKLLESYFITD